MAEAPQADATLDHDELAERFFSQPPPHAWEIAIDDWQPRPLSSGERRAMHTTFALLGLGALVSLGLTLFPDTFMVLPAKLGSTRAKPLTALAQPRAEIRSSEEQREAQLNGLALQAERVRRVPADRNAEPAASTAVSEPRVAAAIAPAVALAHSPAHAPAHAPAVALSPALTLAPALTHSPALTLAHPPTHPHPLSLASARSHARTPATSGTIARARKALDLGHTTEARVLAELAIRKAPERAEGYIVVAGALDALGDRAGMKATFRTCSERARDPLVAVCRSLVR